MLSTEEKSKLEAQSALSKSLSLGLMFSVMPVAGLGSIAAIRIGVRGRKKIQASNGNLVGSGVATWCIYAGVFGLIANIIFFCIYLPFK